MGMVAINVFDNIDIGFGYCEGIYIVAIMVLFVIASIIIHMKKQKGLTDLVKRLPVICHYREPLSVYATLSNTHHKLLKVSCRLKFSVLS